MKYQSKVERDATDLHGNNITDQDYVQHILGQRQYELTDHLGDVLATVSDKRADDSLTTYGVPTGTLDTVKTWKPVTVTAYDYYPFGEYMPTRYTNDSSTHCFNATLPELVPWVYYTPIIPHPLHRDGHLTPTGGGTLTDLSDSMAVELTTTTVGDGFTYDVTGLTPGMVAKVTLDFSGITGKFMATLTDDSTGRVVGSTNVYTTQGTNFEYSIPFIATSTSATLSYTSTSSGAGGGVIAVIGTPHDTVLLENVVTLVCDEDWYRYGFNGQMKNNQYAGLGNHYGYKDREYDTRTGRWSIPAPSFMKYPNLTTYNFVGNSVIAHCDLDGRDLVYFNVKGNEIGRIVSNTQFRTFIMTGAPTPLNFVQGEVFTEVPMPKIITAKDNGHGRMDATTSPVYQKYDYMIAAETGIFNINKNNGTVPNNSNGQPVAASGVPDLDPTLVKATIMQESTMGTDKPNGLNDPATDIMQANVCYNPSAPNDPHQCDWGDGSKADFGLTLGGGATPQQSIHAGIGQMFRKGAICPDGKTSHFVSWERASQRYNGGGAANYGNVLKMTGAAVKGSSKNYVETTPVKK